MREPDHQGFKRGELSARRLSVVVPAYNEAERGLEKRLDQLRAFLRAGFGSYELIVVDDGSNDATPEILARVAAAPQGPADDSSSQAEIARIVRLNENQGKGAAVKAGLQLATGGMVMFMDADLATPLDELSKLIAALDRGADIAIASRGLPESDLRRRESFVRESCGKLYNFLTQRLVISGFKDTQCGFKLFRGDVARALAPAMTEARFGFDVELVYLAVAAGFKVSEVPVRWEHQPDSRVQFLRDGWFMLLALLKFGWRKRTRRYHGRLEQIRARFAAEERLGQQAEPEGPIDSEERITPRGNC
ncbi:MAG TPA: dolichyl-phosphate beta-glucosyltransferase [Armatimonadota bacterium]|nr:dolichyl-phosphate beta-glucosyltransferase [Armatimonadota bacterium]